LQALARIYDEMHATPSPNPLRLLSQATSFCACVGDNLQRVDRQFSDDQAWLTAWRMAEYIHQNYDLKMSLDDIAAAGTVSRSKCCELFSKHIGQTPNTYLTHYRIQKSCEMLRETNRSISEIAIACGFQSGSYFTYVFHKELGAIPQEFRRRNNANNFDATLIRTI
jgi:AraC-like DNA-binding protein